MPRVIPLVHVFDVKNGRLLTKLISVGNGPGEIMKDRLYILYRQTMTLYSLPPNGFLIASEQEIERTIPDVDRNDPPVYKIYGKIILRTG
jgi:hypothetical protein